MNTMGHFVHSKSYMSSYYGEINGECAEVSFLYDRDGKRKYTTIKERRKFLHGARTNAPLSVYTFCALLSYTGARISEVLAMTPRQIDLEAGVIVIRTLKKRRKTPVYRAVPVPAYLLHELDAVHELRAAQKDPQRADKRLWPWGRTTAWKHIKGVMRTAGIAGLQGCPKGLRHGFAIAALEAGVPLNILRKWLGHARLSTTAIYGEAVGAEERAFAKRMWRIFLPHNARTQSE